MDGEMELVCMVAAEVLECTQIADEHEVRRVVGAKRGDSSSILKTTCLALEDAGGDVKTAIVMRSCAVDRLEAQAALDQADGFVRRAQDNLKTRRSGKF